MYVKPGSHAWDARFQPNNHKRPVLGMAIDGGNGWQTMAKCENYMFCKPSGLTLHGQFRLRLISDTGNIDKRVSRAVVLHLYNFNVYIGDKAARWRLH